MSLRVAPLESPAERARLAQEAGTSLDPELPALAAELDGERVGVAALELAPGAAALRALAVRADRRRGGAGSALLRAAAAWAAARGAELLSVQAPAEARSFLERRGFVPLAGDVLARRLGVVLVPVAGLPEIESGADLAALIAERARLDEGDVVVVAQKAVSKAEGRVVRLAEVTPTPRAVELAGDGDPRHVQAILDETARVVRSRPPLVIAETRHGFVCASAGVDASNAPAPEETLVLLPVDPDASAARLRARLRDLTGRSVGVIVSDSFGRPFRQGTTDVAIGAAGVEALRDLRGSRDASGYELRSTQIAIADELAAAADLVRGKASGVPVAIVRGLDVAGDGRARDLIMPAERDLFR